MAQCALPRGPVLIEDLLQGFELGDGTDERLVERAIPVLGCDALERGVLGDGVEEKAREPRLDDEKVELVPTGPVDGRLTHEALGAVVVLVDGELAVHGDRGRLLHQKHGRLRRTRRRHGDDEGTGMPLLLCWCCSPCFGVPGYGRFDAHTRRRRRCRRPSSLPTPSLPQPRRRRWMCRREFGSRGAAAARPHKRRQRRRRRPKGVAPRRTRRRPLRWMRDRGGAREGYRASALLAARMPFPSPSHRDEESWRPRVGKTLTFFLKEREEGEERSLILKES